VDGDGNAIDNCACFVVPDVPRIMAFGRNGDFSWPSPPNRPRLGVTVTTDQGADLDVQGARVGTVMEDGPAEDAGIREGDVITHVDGRSLLEPLDADIEEDFDLDESVPVQRLLAIARELEPGETVEVRYLRDGQAMTATLEVQELGAAWGAWARDFQEELRPQMEELQERLRTRDLDVDRQRARVLDRSRSIPVGPGTASGGLRLTELTPGLGDYFGTDQGVLVTDVDEDSALGLRAGDVILRVGDREATSPERVRRVLASYEPGESVTFRVRRQGSEIDVLGRLGG
jgi:S1-C subfamily serine protease